MLRVPSRGSLWKTRSRKREEGREKKVRSGKAKVDGCGSFGLSISDRGRTYEVSKRANLPISYLSSFPGSRVESEKRIAEGFKAMRDKEKFETWKVKVGGGSREGDGNARRGFPLISRTWLKLVRHKNQVSSLPGIRYRFRSFLSLCFFFSLSQTWADIHESGSVGVNFSKLLVNLNQVPIWRECLDIKRQKMRIVWKF